MSYEHHPLCGFSSVEVENMDVSFIGNTSKQMTSIGETDFITSLDWDSVVAIDSVAQDIAHLNFILKSNDQVQTTGMEG